MMNLSSEDSLRLNVLLKQELQAVRIDESRMMVFALTDKGEVTITLNPNCRDMPYLKQVRELLSNQVLGSPGGYPVYLKRWTRMGQQRENDSLYSLLKLGEPEAVVAVVHSPGLTPELARLAWWVMPEAENARCMLDSPQVVQADIGRELARFLVEYLPFETESVAIFNTVRLVLQSGLLEDEARQKLWQRASRKGTFYVGFLQAMPDSLPLDMVAHVEHEVTAENLSSLLEDDNAVAALLVKVLSANGQAFLKTVLNALDKLADEAAAVAVFDVLGNYFRTSLPVGHPHAQAAGKNSVDAVAFATGFMDEADVHHPAITEVLNALPASRDKLAAMVALSFAGEVLLDSFFSHSDAVGPLMRRKMKAWTEPLQTQINILQQ